MSQRSAFIAAASATADVSDPPRPRVARLPSAATPWKPGMTAMPAFVEHPLEHVDVDLVDQAGGMARGADRQLPAHVGAGVEAHALEGDREQAAGHLLAATRPPRHIRAGRRARRPRGRTGPAGRSRRPWPRPRPRPGCRARPRASPARRHGGSARCPPSRCRRISSRCGPCGEPETLGKMEGRLLGSGGRDDSAESSPPQAAPPNSKTAVMARAKKDASIASVFSVWMGGSRQTLRPANRRRE